MKKVLVLCSVAALMLACATNPLTGKKGLALTNENEQLIPAAYQQYTTFLKENKVVTGTADATKVQNVGAKIKDAAVKWMTSRGFQDQIASYKWEYKLIQSKDINAWCMPGGKIAVFTGIMPVTKDEAGLATVMGHEVAHALLSHSRKRMDKAMIQAGIAQGLGSATSGSSAAVQQGLGLLYGTGSNLAMLAYGRSDESEADRLGLILMAIAGYNPDNATSFWQRMSAQGGSKTPELLSTHPSDKTRIADIQKLIPEAKAEAAKFGKKY